MLNGLKDKIVNISSSAKRNILIASGSLLLTVTIICSIFIMGKTVEIVDGENSAVEVYTFKRYVGDILKDQNVRLGLNDKMNVQYDTVLKDDMKIEIYRSFMVSVTEKGITTEHIATGRTAGEVLLELGYDAKETDKITPGFNEKVSEFDEIILVHTTEKTVTEIEEIPYESKVNVNKTFSYGKRKVIQRGAPGKKEVSYKILFEDGVEVSREAISEKVITNAVAQITEVAPTNPASYTLAAGGTIQTSRSGNLSFSKVLTLNATAYDASSCGKAPSHPAYGITATGMRAGFGIVAVDPSVIPLGSRLYIETADGNYIYGTAIAADTGGAIKGNRIDLCYNTRAEAIQFGRRTVKVYVLR